ncbi:hypothetical protein PhCBS80983_g06093 [Powellomyces hirtus]|uniref:Mitochondrial carrier domain-containing protein n=1 Tax=Powellomyces hirtus TaxID=109895 RepID=A0A507DR73_9FUNG|nr:hypothetical protein PhCBS80983_g06093 [Powellomyces hirtus]
MAAAEIQPPPPPQLSEPSLAAAHAHTYPETVLSGSGTIIPHSPPPLPPPPPHQSSMNLLHVVFSGVLGGSVADACMHPLDTVKTRMQKDGTTGSRKYNGIIYRLESHPGLLGGFRAAVLGSISATTLYFSIYESTKHAFATSGLHPSLSYFSAAALGELFASVLYVPSEVVKTRMQLQGRYNNPHSLSRHNYKSDWEAFRKVVAEGRMYHGWGSTLARDIPLTAVQFTLYENIRSFVVRHQTPHTTPLVSILTSDVLPGAISGFIAGLITTPLDVVKTCLQTQGNPSKPRWQHSGATSVTASLPPPPRTTTTASTPYYEGMLSAFRGIYKRRGVAGLFAGAWARAAWTGSQSTIMFFIYEALLATRQPWD